MVAPGPSTTAWGPLRIAKLVLPIYFLSITYSISYSISYIVFYNYLFLSLNLEGEILNSLNEPISLGNCNKLYRK